MTREAARLLLSQRTGSRVLHRYGEGTTSASAKEAST